MAGTRTDTARPRGRGARTTARGALLLAVTAVSTGCGGHAWLAGVRAPAVTPPGARAAASGLERCVPPDLDAADAGTAVAAGTVVTRIVLRNVSGHACLVDTAVRVQLLDAAGRPVPTTVVRDGTLPAPGTVLLAPPGSSPGASDTAEVQLRWRETCDPGGAVSASSVRVTVPDGAAAPVVATPAPSGRAVPVCGGAVRVEAARAVTGATQLSG